MVDQKGNPQRNNFSANGTAEGEGEKTIHGAELSREVRHLAQPGLHRNMLYSEILLIALKEECTTQIVY